MISIQYDKSGFLFKNLKKKVLLVEDAESILLAINDYLSKEFQIHFVTTIREAQHEILSSLEENAPFDLIVTDIHLSDNTGFDLIRFAREYSKNTKVALITSYEINDYIETIYKECIDQVITKQSRMSLQDISIMARKILSDDIFGIEKYFPDIRVYYPLEMGDATIPGDKEVFSITIKSTKEKIFWINKVAEILCKKNKMPMATSRLVMDELLANAIVRAPRFEDGSFKYQKRNEHTFMLIPYDDIVLEPEDYVIFQYGFYGEWVIFTCQDPHGTLRKNEILYRLHRHISIDPENSLPQGISDSHGRGIFLLREHLTNLIFNIHKDRKTEVIGLYHTEQDIPYKNISIYEKD
ncbi:MAG: response regulator [Spirochaetia bacterium]|nr:response regulator [Spirochaetia bacterium]